MELQQPSVPKGVTTVPRARTSATAELQRQLLHESSSPHSAHEISEFDHTPVAQDLGCPARAEIVTETTALVAAPLAGFDGTVQGCDVACDPADLNDKIAVCKLLRRGL